MYYHTTSDAGAGKDFPVAGRIAVGLKARADLLMAIPTYTFITPLWGAQAQMGMAVVAGNMKVTADATLSRPGGASVSGSSTDTLDGLGDLFPSASPRWSNGNHNTMAYTTDLEAAKADLAAVRSQNLTRSRDCAGENQPPKRG